MIQILQGLGVAQLAMTERWKIPRSGSKAKDGEERERERLKVSNNNGQLCIANATSGGARKAAWANNTL